MKYCEFQEKSLRYPRFVSQVDDQDSGDGIGLMHFEWGSTSDLQCTVLYTSSWNQLPLGSHMSQESCKGSDMTVAER